jgi:hypothetical protein
VFVVFEGDYSIFGAELTAFLKEVYDAYVASFQSFGVQILRLPTHKSLGMTRDVWYEHCLKEIRAALSPHLPT